MEPSSKATGSYLLPPEKAFTSGGLVGVHGFELRDRFGQQRRRRNRHTFHQDPIIMDIDEAEPAPRWASLRVQ